MLENERKILVAFSDMSEPVIHLIKLYQEASNKYFRDQNAELISEILRPQLRRFFPKLYDPMDFDDFEMEALATVFAGLDFLRAETDGEFYKWFNTIAFRTCVNFNRQQNRKRKFFEPITTEEIENVINETAKIDPPNLALKIDLEDAFRTLDKIKPGCRELISNHCLRGVKQVEIAKTLGLQERALGKRIERCLDEFAELLHEQRK